MDKEEKFELHHVLYEMSMFIVTYEFITTQKKGFIRNAVLESYNIHLRNLIEFFLNKRTYKKKGKKIKNNFILVSDLLLEPEKINGLILTEEIRDNKHKLFEIKTSISRTVQHLVKDRCIMNKEDNSKYIGILFPIIKMKIELFVENIEKRPSEKTREALKIDGIGEQLAVLREQLS